jgi:HAD superfamily hydrolase (TIGR01509 family)
MNTAAILWDLDGVLADSTQLHYESWVATFQKRGVEITDEMFKRTFGRNNRAVLQDVFGRPPTEAELDEIAGEKEIWYRALLADRLQILPGVLDWLQRFQEWGFPQAVASSAPPENIEIMMDVLGIRAYFAALVSGANIPGKPDPSVFLLAAERLDVPPAGCIVMEDSPAGVEGARRGGMKCIAVLTTHAAPELACADLIVNRLTDLAPEQVRSLLDK